MEYKTKKGEVILFDESDEDLVLSHTWCVHYGYAATNIMVSGKYKTVYMHRLLLKPGKHQEVDHRNGNRNDNRRENLRVCNVVENRKSKTKTLAASGFKGVYKSNRIKPWCARITVNGKTTYLGLFKTKKSAALTYDFYAKLYYKDFAFTNF